MKSWGRACCRVSRAERGSSLKTCSFPKSELDYAEVAREQMRVKYFSDTDTALVEFTEHEVVETKEVS